MKDKKSTDGRKVIQEWVNECIIGIYEGICMCRVLWWDQNITKPQNELIIYFFNILKIINAFDVAIYKYYFA